VAPRGRLSQRGSGAGAATGVETASRWLVIAMLGWGERVDASIEWTQQAQLSPMDRGATCWQQLSGLLLGCGLSRHQARLVAERSGAQVLTRAGSAVELDRPGAPYQLVERRDREALAGAITRELENQAVVRWSATSTFCQDVGLRPGQ